MELKGTVILNEETLSALEEDIREKVIAEISKNGNNRSEIVTYLKDCSSTKYGEIIIETLDDIIEKTNEDELQWEKDDRIFHMLKTLQMIIPNFRG